MIYLIGSLRNPEVPKIAAQLRGAGFDIFDDWFAAGRDADNSWRDYEKARGRTFVEALAAPFAKHVFEFDFKYLKAAETAVLVLPAGKSGHLELGWALNHGKRGFVLLDSPERWDCMYQLATGVYNTIDELIIGLEMPYVAKPGDAPQIVTAPIVAQQETVLYPAPSYKRLCFSCGRAFASGDNHSQCRGATP